MGEKEVRMDKAEGTAENEYIQGRLIKTMESSKPVPGVPRHTFSWIILNSWTTLLDQVPVVAS